MTRVRTRPRLAAATAFLLAVSACGGSPAADDDPGDDGGTPDAPVGVDAAGGDGPLAIDASPDARPDTCPPPAASIPFAVDVPPPPGADTNQRHAVLSVPDSGIPQVLVSRLWQNGSFFDANLIALSRTAPGSWTSGGLANGGIGLSVASQLAATHGADPCVAYSDDYSGQLHLRCATSSSGDRVVAPAISSSLSLAADGATKHLVYVRDGTLVWQPFAGDPGVAEPIEPAWQHGPSAVAIGPTGTVHVVYVVQDAPVTGVPHVRRIRHATRTAGTWELETVVTDGWIANEGDSVALALIGDEPVIAYHDSVTRGLHLARRTAGGFTLTPLLVPDPGFDSDRVGGGVALAVDCVERLHAVYERILTTDVQPTLYLHYAEIVGDVLANDVALPITASTAYHYRASRYGLGFHIDASGRQYVSAELGSIFGVAAYFATR